MKTIVREDFTTALELEARKLDKLFQLINQMKVEQFHLIGQDVLVTANVNYSRWRGILGLRTHLIRFSGGKSVIPHHILHIEKSLSSRIKTAIRAEFAALDSIDGDLIEYMSEKLKVTIVNVDSKQSSDSAIANAKSLTTTYNLYIQEGRIVVMQGGKLLANDLAPVQLIKKLK